MNDEKDEQNVLEPWISLSNWEQQCVDEVEKSPDIEVELQNEKDIAVQKLWILFQNAATCIAQLYQDRQHGVSLWVPFQNAASSVTNLYKECVESHKPIYELGFQSGFQRRNRDLLSWAKKKKRNIQREELIAYITGRNPPAARHWGPRPRLALEGVRNSQHARFPADDTSAPRDEEQDFDMFRQALAFSNSLRQHAQSSPTSGISRVHRSRHVNSTSTSHSELSAFITEEFSKHGRKRSPSTDVIMDSPTHKRTRLI